MPYNVTLLLTRAKSSTIFGTMKDMTIKMLKFGDSGPKCELKIDMVEVQPVSSSHRPSLAGLYGLDLYHSAPLQRLTAGLQAAKRLDGGQFVGQLSPESRLSFSLALEAVVFG